MLQSCVFTDAERKNVGMLDEQGMSNLNQAERFCVALSKARPPFKMGC